MSILLPRDEAATFARRRAALARQLGGTPAVIYAGAPRPRNFPHNPYPFRAESHFLYLTGASLPGAVLLVRGDAAELFCVPPQPGDDLWHGEVPDTEAIRAATGVDRVRPVDELDDAIAHAGVADVVGTVAAVDPETRRVQAAQLGRRWADVHPGGALEGVDGEVADALINVRLVHDAAALEALREAASGTADAHAAGMAATAPGRREWHVRAAMEGALAARGMTTSYGSIVTVHGEVLHNDVHHHELRDGDLLLVDVGGEHEGWAGDVTRTWPVNGRFSPTQRAVYDVVLQAELDAIAMVKPGARYRDIHLRACRTLAAGLVELGLLRGEPDGLVERGAHAIFFPHGVGHLLGLDVHDMEDLGDRAGYAPGRSRSAQFGTAYLRLDRDLTAGMLVTIEPGIYFVPGILRSADICGPFDADGTLVRDQLTRFADVRGIRIEDDVLCTRGEPEVLTAAIPKAAEAVEAAIGGA